LRENRKETWEIIFKMGNKHLVKVKYILPEKNLRFSAVSLVKEII